MDIGSIVLPDQVGEDIYPPPVSGRVAHIDADFSCYMISAETRDELSGLKPRKTFDEMKYNIERHLEQLMRITGSTSYVAHLTPSGSDKGHRDHFALTKPYQGNRRDKAKPEYLNDVRAYVGENLPSVVNLHQEADDSMAQANYNAEDSNLSVIVSKDKDLRMVPGLHWDFDEEMIVDVDDPFGSIWIDRSKKTAKLLGWGSKFFWAQLLMGDTADNIAGLPSTVIDDKSTKVGPITAYSLLEGYDTDAECFTRVKELWAASEHEWMDYRDNRETTWKQHMLGDMRLLWMRRYPDEDDVINWLGTL